MAVWARTALAVVRKLRETAHYNSALDMWRASSWNLRSAACSRLWQVVAVSVVLAAGCQDKHAANLLIDGFSSFSNIEKTRGRLDAAHLEYKLQNESLPAGDPRPPFNVAIITDVSFTHLGMKGELQLRFLNDRLWSTWFFPDEPEKYAAQLSGKLGMKIGDKETSVSRHVRGYRHQDHRGKTYFGWEDERLKREHDAWLREHS